MSTTSETDRHAADTGGDTNGKEGDGDYQETPASTMRWRKAGAMCNRKLLLKRLPILQWLPDYERSFLVEDIVAGLSVGLTVVPQAIAYAIVANLDPQYGLYSAFMGCFVYFIFGSCKDVTIGPTAIMSLMVQVYVANLGPDFAILMTFLTGVIVLLLGLLNLGFLVQFISMPVTAGFTSAAALTIASGQVKSLLGLPGKSNEFLESWINVFEHIGEAKLWDSVLGVSTVIILLLLRHLRTLKGSCAKVGKYVALARNALVVIGGALLAFYFSTQGVKPFALTGTVTPGLPPLQPPPFSTIVNNRTLNFGQMVSELGTSIIALPMISILETIAICKAFSKGKAIDATQELIALGLANIAGSFVCSMPITGSFTRSAVNNSSGVRTTFGGVVTGILVLLSVGFLTDTFYYIPKTVLAAVIIAAMFFMVEFHAAAEIWRTKKLDMIPFVVTLVVCLGFGLEYGMVAGIVVNLCFVLYKTSRPAIEQRVIRIEGGAEALVVKPDQSLIYSSVEYLKHQLLKMACKNAVEIVIVDGSNVSYVDCTAAKVLSSMVEDLQVQERTVVLWSWKRDVRCTLLRMNQAQFATLFRSGSWEEVEKSLTLGQV